MNNIVLSANQAIQLAALGPCLFIIGYIIISSTRWKLSVIPILFFVSLSGIFLLPIMSLFPEYNSNEKLAILLPIINYNLLPVLSFLLISQFILGKFPPLAYWLVLAVPFIGGGTFIYLAGVNETICFASGYCYEPIYLERLYNVFGASLILMLLVAVIHRADFTIHRKDKNRRHKYWLIITLVMFNLVFVGIELGVVSGNIKLRDAEFVKTMIGVGFVYVVLSSVFRVFSESLGIDPWRVRSRALIAKDRWIAERITWILREEKPYRNLGFNRKKLAELLEIKEHTVSRIINERFGKSFSELMNECRIHDAKQALRDGGDPITVISYDTGFSSLTSFNRVFKEATGLSPTQYREQSVKNDNLAAKG